MKSKEMAQGEMSAAKQFLTIFGEIIQMEEDEE